MREAFKFIFPYTLPIMAGYIFLAIPFSILALSQGLSPLLIALMSVFIFAGALQFSAVNILAGTFDPLSALVITLMMGARHVFYSIAMLVPFSKIHHWTKPYTIYAMTDETFSLFISMEIPAHIDKAWAYFFIGLLNHIYWITGTIIGIFIGNNLSINIQGIEFVLTALFLSIFSNQMAVKSNRIPGIVGLISGIIALFIFGPNKFMIPAMLIIIVYFVYKYYQEGDV